MNATIPMIIVHVFHSFYPIIGGLERVVQRIAEEQAKLGHEVHVVTSRCDIQDRPKEEVLDNVYVHRIKAWRLVYLDITIPVEYPDSILKRADIVHIHSQNSLFNIKIAERAKHYGTKVVVHFMAVNALSTHPNSIKRTLGFRYQRELTQKALKVADLRLVKSLRDLQVLREKYGIDAVYVPDGIDEVYFRKPRDPRKFRETFQIGKDEHVFLYIGRLHPAKGPQVLIKAAAILREHNIKFRAVLVGPGPQKWLIKIIKKLNLKKYVILTGPLSGNLKISAIDASTCVVVPSLYDYVEAFSLVVSEAWAREKPVVASAVGEMPYRIKHGVNGLLVPPNNPNALAKALVEITQCNLRVNEARLETWNEIARKLCLLYKSNL